jgi:hypothetical protein
MRSSISPSLTIAMVVGIVLVAGACAEKPGARNEATAAAKREPAAAAEKATAAPSPEAASVIAQQVPTYPLRVCPVSGKELGSMGEPYNHVHEARLVRFCCDGCIEDFDKDPAMYLAKIDAAAAAGASRSE